MKHKRSYGFLIILVLIVVLAGGGWLGVNWYMGSAPQVLMAGPPTHLGSKSKLKFTIHDPSQKLSMVRIYLIQGTRETLAMEEKYSSNHEPAIKREMEVEIQPKTHGLSQGPATCVIQAWGKPLGDFYLGKTTRRELAVTVDTIPPRVSSVSRTINIRLGGSGLAVYNISPDVTRHGVSVGKVEYKGSAPWKDNPQIALAYFALAQDQERKTPMQIWAEDAAGNRTELPLPARVRGKRFRQDKFKLSARTIKALVAKLGNQAPQDLKDEVEIFTWINTTLRKNNNDKIHEVASKISPQQLWEGAFARPRGKPMAGFGDRRTYFHSNKQISKAVHLGADLADIAQSDITAAARGRVVYTAPLGIYGNCLIIDHGLGVMSLYAHLSQISVSPGQMVNRDQVVAQSGATGMALGDHLHFSILVGGIFVQPNEWWDPHWIEDNVTLRFEEAELKPPLDIAPQNPKKTKSKADKPEEPQKDSKKKAS